MKVKLSKVPEQRVCLSLPTWAAGPGSSKVIESYLNDSFLDKIVTSIGHSPLCLCEFIDSRLEPSSCICVYMFPFENT